MIKKIINIIDIGSIIIGIGSGLLASKYGFKTGLGIFLICNALYLKGYTINVRKNNGN